RILQLHYRQTCIAKTKQDIQIPAATLLVTLYVIVAFLRIHYETRFCQAHDSWSYNFLVRQTQYFHKMILPEE
ncbi:MAG TPA: hypothetical protein VFV38_24290, partial [Ktedonobacteraceae bacterium]|nr:hypothetical protein [Ktedonobacteraceae bacterium]